MSTKGFDNRHKEELLGTPKDTVTGMAIAIRVQVFWFSLIVAGVLLAAGVAFMVSIYAIHEERWQMTANVLLLTTSLLAMFWIPLLWKAYFDIKALDRLAGGQYLARWPIPDEQWAKRSQTNQDTLHTVLRRIVLGAAAVGFSGVIAGDVLDLIAGGESGMELFPAIFPRGLNIVGYSVGGAVLGLGVAQCIRFFANIRWRVESSHSAQVVVSKDALYVTGCLYRKSLFTEPSGVAFCDDQPNHLQFAFKTSGGEGTIDHSVVVPFPADAQATIDALVTWLNSDSAR